MAAVLEMQGGDMDIDCGRWASAQGWIDALEREARVAYWNTRIEFERRVNLFLDAVAGEDDDER